MSDELERIRAALAERYEVQSVAGMGGMGLVCVARDLRHPRQVAIKVLQPDLGAAIGHARFQREIAVVAALTHPGIVPLYDSGEAGGVYYYVMPLIEGESLAARLEREGQLPLDEALRITRDVAEALSYAHSHHVIHRDIKPANIMLAGGHASARALLTDFGIARLIGQAETQHMTDSGLTLGTPTYMSPEQGNGAPVVDGRSDVYALACVLYEMLIGEPPFHGASPQAIIARHTHDPVPAMRIVRGTIPPAVEQAVRRALAKTPADRFATAAEFAAALAAATPMAAIPDSRRWYVRAAAVIAVASLAVGGWQWTHRTSTSRADERRVAVIVHAAADSASQRMATELTDLISQRLADEAAPPGARAGIQLLARLTISGDRVAASATMQPSAGGREFARADNVRGSRDSLAALADRLVAEILVRRSGEPAERMGMFLATPLPVLRSYLAGRAALAHGAYQAADRQFADALRGDSTFAPAALGRLSTTHFHGENMPGLKATVWASRERLGTSDSLYALALLGPRYPAAPTDSEVLAGWDVAVAAMPDRPDVWFLLGESLFHQGVRVGIPNALERAGAAYRHALTIDSAFAPALLHLVDLVVEAGDAEGLARARSSYLALDSVGELADYVRWRAATRMGDSVTLGALRRRWNDLTSPTLERIISAAELDGRDLDDALRAARTLRQRGDESATASRYSHKLREVLLNGGRPAEANALARASFAKPGPQQEYFETVAAIVWEGDTTVGAAQARASIAPSPRASDPEWYRLCAGALYRAWHGDEHGGRAAVARLRRAVVDSTDLQQGYVPLCAATVDALLAAHGRRADASRRLEELDARLRVGPPATTWALVTANLASARLHEQRGEIAEARIAVRRRAWLSDFGELRILVGLSTLLREEGRLSALLGDRPSAIRAYRHYLALRTDPEPAKRPAMDSVKAELARLEAQR